MLLRDMPLLSHGQRDFVLRVQEYTAQTIKLNVSCVFHTQSICKSIGDPPVDLKVLCMCCPSAGGRAGTSGGASHACSCCACLLHYQCWRMSARLPAPGSSSRRRRPRHLRMGAGFSLPLRPKVLVSPVSQTAYP